MPYIKRVKPKCVCVLPKIEGRKYTFKLDAGTIWKCPHCETQYMLTRNGSKLFWQVHPF